MKQSRKIPSGSIEPNRAYTTSQVSDLLGVHPFRARNLAEELKAKRVGKEYLFLGENILRFLGSATYNDKDHQEE